MDPRSIFFWIIMNSQWHDIPGYEWLYQFNWYTNEVRSLDRITNSSNWRIYHHKWKILKNTFASGRLYVVFCRKHKTKTYSLWQLTLLITQWPPPQWMVCCHKDDNQYNNLPENVRYWTVRDNIYDCIDNGKHAKPPRKVIRSDWKIFDTVSSVWRNLMWEVSRCCRWKVKTAYGYSWRYLSDTDTNN